jgi:hypothetical protein
MIELRIASTAQHHDQKFLLRSAPVSTAQAGSGDRDRDRKIHGTRKLIALDL